jgi:HPt (histidine-containing phosphotransfer) domain-containing protein
MNAHVAKPLDVPLMLRTMAEWIVSSHSATPPAEPGPATDWRPPEGMGAIDTVDGLARCLGKTHLYRRILRGFREANRDFPASVGHARSRGAWDEALRRTHDLKGLAGTIGAHGLHGASQALQRALVGPGRAGGLDVAAAGQRRTVGGDGGNRPPRRHRMTPVRSCRVMPPTAAIILPPTASPTTTHEVAPCRPTSRPTPSRPP